ncbi:FAD-binding oxidoreductase [Chelativorans alearense]|uniref:FAD-binding oxidoreductase n=1 Tax=Chelativorans alearense TaxID=2681495 RepID=UPI0013D04BF2|nr:FAD-binding oxidoreductase [Chelativorans alearense]
MPKTLAPDRTVSALREIVGPKGILTGDDMAGYLTDWRARSTGTAECVVMPASTEEVSKVVSYCSRHALPLYVQGGNTSLCGGSVPGKVGGDILLSTRRLNAVREIDPVSNLAVVEAGLVLANLHEIAEKHDRIFPMHLGSEGTAQIGGLLSTNSGGVSAVRYGPMRDLVAGLEVVLPDGSVISRLNGLRKDNRGFDWKHLFIGGEGTLGIVTAAALKLHTKMTARADALVAISSPAQATEVFRAVRDRFDTRLTACELVSGTEVSLTLKHVPGLRFPTTDVPDWMVLIELGDTGGEEALREGLQECLAELFENGTITDAVVCQNLRESEDLWKWRHSFSEANKKAGHGIVFDPALRVKSVPEFIERAIPAALEMVPLAIPLTVCHLGDGNSHLIVMILKEDLPKIDDLEELTNRMFERIHDIVADLGGSFSAEHGIGRKLVEELVLRQPPAEIALMRAIKQAIDPTGIMSPGVLLG